MAILEKEVWVTLHNKTIRHYELLGYKIPRNINKYNKLTVKTGTKILVKVEDLKRGSHVKVTKVCDECDKHVHSQEYNNILSARKRTDGKDRCYECGQTYAGNKRKNNVKYENSLEFWAKENDKEYLLEEYSDKNHKKPSDVSYGTPDDYLWSCPNCSSEYDMAVSHRIRGNNCPYCSEHRSFRVNHTNCLWTTHPEIAKLLTDPQRGYKITYGSGKKEEFKCPNCGDIDFKTTSNIVKRGFSCSRCSDGLSYPEKFMIYLFNQLNVKYETQKTFEWSMNKRYDFYLNINNEMIIETHGEQHYNGGFEHVGGRTLEEEQDNDRLKEQLARENGMNTYIVLDCRYSELKWIKNSILNSKLNELFDLSDIDWLKCHEFACDTIVKIICELWNSGIKSTKEIGKKLQLNRTTILKYLKQGAELGWCDYNPMEAQRIGAKSKCFLRHKPVLQLSLQGELIKEWGSIKDAEKSLGCVQISSVCRWKRKSSGGFLWVYEKDYDSNKIYSYSPRKNNKPVIQLTLDNEFIKEWESATEVYNVLGVDKRYISKACREQGKQTHGFKWMFKEDYNQYIIEQSKELVHT